MTVVDHQPLYTDSRIVMFVGKGGVGKTTCAATTALHCASSGQQSLAISTDPTPSLSHIYEVDSEPGLTKILDSLYLRELGMQEIKEMWDRKFGRQVHEVFSSFVSIEYAEFVDFITSILPGLRDEFMVDYIRHLADENQYRKIIWDTAPLGQTLSLLQMPAMLGRHLRTAPRIYSKLKLGRESRKPVLDILRDWERLSGEDMDFLRGEVRFIMVTIPEALAVKQLDRVFAELREFGLKVERLIINNVIADSSSELLATRAEQQQHYIKALHDSYPDMKIVEVPMFPREITGLDRLRAVGQYLLA
ncbi:ArsA family ATPase [Chloroflexota bacterium]